MFYRKFQFPKNWKFGKPKALYLYIRHPSNIKNKYKRDEKEAKRNFSLISDPHS